ncbi:L,D-transpeptidase [Anaerobacterium chartisolvens]|nr:L,D-transpeptidase [Anaerobacterium chartisolvens]
MHGTKQEGSVGSAASHGCIRMYKSDIRELYDIGAQM